LLLRSSFAWCPVFRHPQWRGWPSRGCGWLCRLARLASHTVILRGRRWLSPRNICPCEKATRCKKASNNCHRHGLHKQVLTCKNLPKLLICFPKTKILPVFACKLTLHTSLSYVA